MTRFDVIYQPKGAALEYSAWACNIVKSAQRSDGPRSCSHGCLYCYNPPGTQDGPALKDNILSRLENDLKKLKEVIKSGERLEFTFVGDLYDPSLPDYISRRCLEACKKAGIPFQVLTKNGVNARADFDLYGSDCMFGVTLTCDNDADSLKWEPGATLWSERIAALQEAHKRGIKTWVSFEPVVDPKQTLHLIELVAPFADKIKVGKMNSNNKQSWHNDDVKTVSKETDWADFGRKAITLLKSLGKEFYIKEDLRKHLSPDDLKVERFSDVPPSLRIKNNWCAHKKDGERPKIPHHPDGYKMAWSISANWVSFISARDAYLAGLDLPETNKRRFDGIGFFISREKDAKLDVYAIDLDHCRNADTGEIDQWAKDLLTRLNSYSEVSPSGTGVHVFVKGMLPSGVKNTNDQMKDKNRVEVFVDKHHITITGERLKEYPSTIEDRSEIIAEIYNEVMEVKKSKKEAKRQTKIKTKRIIYDGKEAAKKKYVASAIEDEIQILKNTPEGGRNNQLNKSAFAIGQFVGARCIGRGEAERELKRAARACGMDEGKDGVEATIRSGLDDGELHPRDIPDPEEIKSSTAAFPLPQITVIPATKSEKKTVAAASQTEEKKSIATQLVNLAIKNSFERWHTPDGEPYITVAVNSHREHYRISTKSNLIKAWIGRLGRDVLGKTPSVSSIRDAINNLVGIAIYDGAEHRLYVRKAEIDGKIYIDLGDPAWSVVEVSEDGWKITRDCGIYFRRSKNMLPLPMPERGGEIEDLRKIINAKTEECWILTLAWLTQAFWCRGPYAHLYLRGTQGTAKSYMMQALKSISDPSAAMKRRLPKSERDAAIALGSESIPCFDNMSGVSDEIADLLCVASTGGVSSQRALFTDDEEAIIFVKCPIVANGIDDIGQRGDLLDRTIVNDLEPIPENERKTEKEMQKVIDENRAKLFGCLLDMTSQGLSDIDSVDLDEVPRMADFAEWAYACLGNAGDKFIEAYLGSREEIKHDLVEANAFPRAVRTFAKSLKGVWTGTASELLDFLNKQEYIREGYEPAEWPRTANQLGSELRRHVPDLEISGVVVKFSKSHKKARSITISYEPSDVPPKDDDKKEDKDRPPKTDNKDDGDKGDNDILEEEEEDIIRGVVGEVPSKTKFSLPQKRRPLVPLVADSDSVGTRGEDKNPIRTAALIEWGLAGWADPRKIATKLDISLDEVIKFFEAENSGYIKTANGMGYTQKGRNLNSNHDHQNQI